MKYKSGFVTIVGRPNVGKSTLMNKLIGEKIAIISNKPQTTRNIIRGVITLEDSQIIFLDTPGIHKPKSKLGKYMVNNARSTFGEVDVIIFLVEANNRPHQGDLHVLEQLKKQKNPVFLGINKIDLINKEILFSLINEYTKEFSFEGCLPISALNGDGVPLLMNEIKKILPEGPKYFPDDTLTDQPEKVIVSEIIREKILRSLDEEVPHGAGVEIISFKERIEKEILDIQATIYCEKESHKGIIIGKQGKMLKKIGSLARHDIEKFLDIKVYLELWVKVKDDWRNSENMLKTLGYNKNS